MQQSARFVTGSTWRHVIVMTLTNSVGLMALFLVDLIDLYFLNLLGEQEMAASVGFSAQLLFYVTALAIGLLVAVGILVSQRIGAKNILLAKRIAGSTIVIACCLVAVISGLLLWFLDDLLTLLGATGHTHDLSVAYSRIMLPSSVILVTGMVTNAVLRGVGDAKRSMNATLLGAAVNLCLDPLFIFYFGLGIEGAAWASVFARCVIMGYALYCVIHIHRMLTMPSFKGIRDDFMSIAKLAGPAMLTNLATPVGSTFVMTTIAKYGDSAVAAYATIGRITPVAFSVLFALSGAISPIIGQNYGAKAFDRVAEVYRNAIVFAISIVIFVSCLLWAGQSALIGAFHLSGEAAQLLSMFCSGLCFFFIADGVLFSTNSAFNSLGFPLYSTVFNYAKYFLGIVPTVWGLSYFYEAQGVIVGQAVGSILVTLIAVITCNRLIARVGEQDTERQRQQQRVMTAPPLWPGSSSKTQS